MMPLKNKTFIAFGSKARQGKDLSAKAIHEAFPLITRVISFADALKAFCRIAYGMRCKDAALLQQVGSELRARDEDVFVKALYHAAADTQEPYVLIADTRYPNEAEFVRGMGGYLVQVVRELPDGRQYISPDRDPQHPSEVGLDGYDLWDAVITSPDGEMHTLTCQARQVFGKLRLLSFRH